MRVANLDGRLALLTGSGALDVEHASGGRFGAVPQDVYARWAEFVSWAATASGGTPYDPDRLGLPVARPADRCRLGRGEGRLVVGRSNMERPVQLCGERAVVSGRAGTCTASR
ncbi:hypothetical protein GCM10010191_61050 [Actinomadura vinacea]|uniref:Uncharacterized protein n=1 Tax=Actinomadura vinacea TaxID=115336 RepID=A0ABP5WW48_9ACTN